MNHAQHLERNPVRPLNQNRQRFRARDPNQPRCGMVPFRIANGALLQIEVRDLTGGKYQQEAAGPQMRDCLFERAAVGNAALRAIERIDEEAQRRQFRQSSPSN